MNARQVLQQSVNHVFKTFEHAMKDVTYIRNVPDTTIPNEAQPYFDPVAEVWVMPEPTDPIENPNLREVELKGVSRRIRSRLRDRFSLTNSDRTITFKYDNFKSNVGWYPAVDDRIITEEGDFRVIGWELDSMDITITLILRKNP